MKYKNTVSEAVIGIMTIIIISLILFIVDLDIGAVNVFSLIAIDAFIIWIYFKFMNFDKDELKINTFLKRENILIIFGLIIILVAVSTPFMIMWTNNYKYNLDFFGKMGPVGDFFGGTTVGLLSLASLMFVTAAMFMQKEELELQRNEVANIRKEYEITNSTMRKQAFDSIFFNLINLHHSLVKDLSYDNFNGRNSFKLIKKKFRESYNLNNKSEWCNYFFSEVCFEDDEINIFFSNQQEILNSTDKVKAFNNEEIYEIDYHKLDSGALEEVRKKILSMNVRKRRDLFPAFAHFNGREIDHIFEWKKTRYFNDYFTEIRKPSLKVRNYCYKKFYLKEGYILSNYFNNLKSLIKTIFDFEYSGRKEIDEPMRENYLEILKAQMTLDELEIFYYHINYYDKNIVTKAMLENSDLFSELMIVDNIKWKNVDLNELEYYMK